jgi:hypothetical protein
MTRTLLVSLALLLSAPRVSAHAAEGSGWSATFPAQSVATHLGEAQARYMVVPAGDASPELAQAEQALTAALRTGGKATLVMSAQALGPVAQLSDGEIVQRGASFPVDRVAVLRLFPDGAGALTQAVVSIYDTTGTSLGTFSAVAGAALGARTEAAAPAEGPEAQAAPPEVAAAAPPPAAPLPLAPAPLRPRLAFEERQEQYEQRHIAFDEIVAVNAGTGTVVSQWTVPYEGKYRKPLQGKAFYEKVGRRDLVKAYEDKLAMKTVIGVLGGAAVVGGGLLTYSGVTTGNEQCDAFSSSFDACFERNRQSFDRGMSKTMLGIGVAAGGLGILVAAALVSPHPVSASQARELADGYNKKLKAELGLGEPEDAPTRPHLPPVLQARVGATVGPRGAGLLVSGTF